MADYEIYQATIWSWQILSRKLIARDASKMNSFPVDTPIDIEDASSGGSPHLPHRSTGRRKREGELSLSSKAAEDILIPTAGPSASITSDGIFTEQEPNTDIDTKPRRPRRARGDDVPKPDDEKPGPSRTGWNTGPDGKDISIDDQQGAGSGIGFLRRRSAKKRTDSAGTHDIEDASADKAKKQTTIGTTREEDTVIMVIPDLDDVQEDDMMTTVAAAPAVPVNRFKTIKELDNELMASTGQLVEPPTSVAGIDVSLLVSLALVSPDEVQEADTHWDWDVIYTEVTAGLHEKPVPA
ncbi:intraflagellar transport protein 43-domain-containing protein [Phlyctochytrium arcticum]|nr:intraflagellar transport protein 43-domain-containing protein [Phlyctochytrium arcticum]